MIDCDKLLKVDSVFSKVIDYNHVKLGCYFSSNYLRMFFNGQFLTQKIAVVENNINLAGKLNSNKSEH